MQHLDMTADAPTRCALYLRQSLDATGEQLAVARQRASCLDITARKGWTVVAEFVDNSISASDKRKARPGYDALVDAYGNGEFDALICYDLDRLTRQPRQLEDWIDAATDRGLLLVTANGEADLSTDGGRMYGPDQGIGGAGRDRAQERPPDPGRSTAGRSRAAPVGHAADRLHNGRRRC
jgi:site-specific DNA recombinase